MPPTLFYLQLALVVALTVAALLSAQIVRERSKRRALARLQVQRTRVRDLARQSLAFGLHDEALQNLMYVRLLLSPERIGREADVETLGTSDTGPAAETGTFRAAHPPGGLEGTVSLAAVKEARAVAYDVASQIREIIEEIMPSTLGSLTLAAGIEGMLRRMGRAHPDVTFELAMDQKSGRLADEPGALLVEDEHLRAVAYSVVEEAVRNAVGHARPGTVRVTLNVRRDLLLVSVSNDGRPVGQDLSDSPSGTVGAILLQPTMPVLLQMANEGRYGLIEAVERAESVGGHISIESGTGLTTITLAAPLRQTMLSGLPFAQTAFQIKTAAAQR